MAQSSRSATGAEGPDPNAVYALGSSVEESARLQRQADELAADSAVLLDRVGLRSGQTVIDLGCGPRGILDLLARRVAPAGRAHLRDPHTIEISGLLFLTWGRKPTDAGRP
jgi:hypothetical protein